MSDFFDKKNDDIESRLAAFEVPAKRFGSIEADLSVRPLRTGFSAFERIGLIRANRPDLFVLGARPGNGKTSFLVQVLRNIAKAGEGATLMFSLEMDGGQLMLRSLAAETATNMDRLQHLPAARLAAAKARLSEEPFFVDDTSGMDINTLRARVADFHRRTPLACIGVDYLQIIKASEQRGTRREEVLESVEGLKQLAKDLSIPVLALAQMSRDIEKRQQNNKTARPAMSDLQECGGIENWADQIMFLDGAGKRDPLRAGEIDCYVVKNRHGAAEDFILRFDGATTRFSDFEEGL